MMTLQRLHRARSYPGSKSKGTFTCRSPIFLRDWLSGKIDLALISREVVDDEIAELERHIEAAKDMPTGVAKVFIKDAYEQRDKLKNMQIDKEDLATQANIKDMNDGFKIDHTNLRATPGRRMRSRRRNKGDLPHLFGVISGRTRNWE